MDFSPVTLVGRHVRLEPLSGAHRSPLVSRGSDARIWRWMPTYRADPSESAGLWFDRMIDGAARREVLAWAIVEVATGEPVGGTSCLDLAPKDQRLEIGSTWLTPAVWRTAINTECKFLLLGHAFEQLGCNRVQLKTDSRNERSQAAIARLGAVREGVLRAHMVMPDGWVRDTVMFSIIAAEWPGVKARLEGMLAR